MKKVSLVLAFIAFVTSSAFATTDTLAAKYHPDGASEFKIVYELTSGEGVAKGYTDTTSVDTVKIVALIDSNNKVLPAPNLSPKVYPGVGKKGVTPTGKQVPQNDFTAAVFHTKEVRTLTYLKNGFVIHYKGSSGTFDNTALADWLGVSTYFTKDGQLNH